MGSADIVDILLTLDRRSVSTYLKDWNEHLHPRDSEGRFSETGVSVPGSTASGMQGRRRIEIDIEKIEKADQFAARREAIARFGSALVADSASDPALHGQLLRVGATPEEGAANIAHGLIQGWDGFSTTSVVTWGLQVAAAKLTGTDTSELEQRMSAEPARGDAFALGVETDATTLLDEARAVGESPAVKSFAAHVYADTQQHLAKRKVAEVTLYRGLTFKFADDPMKRNPEGYTELEQTVDVLPLSSWTTDVETAAKAFGTDWHQNMMNATGTGYVVSTTLPAERIFSFAATGMGDVPEHEVVVVGPPVDAKVATSMATVEQISERLKDWNEHLHPRDDHGRFSETEGGGTGGTSFAGTGGKNGARVDDRIQQMADDNDIEIRYGKPSDPSDIQGDASGFHVTLTVGEGYSQEWLDAMALHELGHQWQAWNDADGPEHSDLEYETHAWDVAEQLAADLGIPWTAEKEAARQYGISSYARLETLRGDKDYRHPGAKDFNPALHPRDDQGQFAETAGGWTRDPVERLTALKGAWKDWQRAGITEMSSAQIAAHGDPRLEVTGYAGSILGGDPVAARWQGDHIQITAEGWDRSEPDMRAFLLAHETSHAAAADILANNANKDELLHPFRNTPNGQTFSENALVFPGESDSFARGPEEMMADVGANLLTFGRNVLWDRFESEKEFDISPTPPDPRLVRLYDTVAESLDRVGNPPPDHDPKKASDFIEAEHPRNPDGTFRHSGGSELSLADEITGRVESRAGYHEGETVMAHGALGTIMRIDGVGAHVEVHTVAGLQDVNAEGIGNAGKPITKTWVLPMDAAGPLNNAMSHAIPVNVDDGSGRTYAVTYGRDTETYLSSHAMYGQRHDSYFEHATDQLKAMIERNHELEADTGLTNPWSGVMHLGIDYGSHQSGAVGTKNWDCSINLDQDYMRRVESGATNGAEFEHVPGARGPAMGRTPGDITPSEARMIYSHELAHGLSSAAIPEWGPGEGWGPGTLKYTQRDEYVRDPGFEEGVVQGYVEALAQVEEFGPDAPAFGRGVGWSDFESTDPKGAGAYHSWVLGLDDGLKIAKTGLSSPDAETASVVKVKDRLDYYRDLLTTPLPERQGKVDGLLEPVSDYVLVLTGQGLGTKMGYELHHTVDGVDYEVMARADTRMKARSSIHDLIFTAETPEQARAIYEQVQAYLATDPPDYLEVARDAEALVMFITAHQPTQKSKEFTEHLHPRDDHGRFARTGGLGAAVAGETSEGRQNAANLFSEFRDLIEQAPEKSGPRSAEANLKRANVERLGGVLYERSKDDPALATQLHDVGARVMSYPGAALDDYLGDHLGVPNAPMSFEEIGSREVAAQCQDTWMQSASDDAIVSWALQTAAANRTGADQSGAREYLAGMNREFTGEPDSMALSAYMPEGATGPFTFLDKVEVLAKSPAMKAYVDEVYTETQAHLADRGITELTLDRGVSFTALPSQDPFWDVTEPVVEEVTLNPLSSCALVPDSALDFATSQSDEQGSHNGYVLTLTVPAERVFSLPLTGPGCLWESEAIIVGGPTEAHIEGYGSFQELHELWGS